MSVVDPYEQFYSHTVSRKFGFPHGYGSCMFGVSRYGYDDIRAGIYRRQPSKKGQIFVKNKFYWPVDTITPERLIVRDKLRQGVLAWQALSPEEKAYYNKLQYPTHMSGYNRFLSLWLNS